MSWLTQRDPQTSINYRKVEFIGGRILQARELNDLQTSEAARRQDTLSSIFRNGAAFNLDAAIVGNGVTLRRKSATERLAIVLNASCESLDETTVLLPAPKASGVDILYAHWVLWRVTPDGLHNGTPGCLTDSSLIDAATNEKAAERAQFQMVLSFDASLSAEALDPVRMLAKSTAPVPVLEIVWDDATPSVAYYDPFLSTLAATDQTAGVARMSTPTSNVAVADDDPRLGAGIAPESIKTSMVSRAEETGGTTTIQSAEIKTGVADTGIDCDRLWYAPLKAKVSDVLTYLASRAAALATMLDDHANRLTVLENRPAPNSSALDGHIGSALGKNAGGGFSHKPLVVDMLGGYEMVGSGSTSTFAYMVRLPDGTLVGGVTHAGDFVLVNANLAAMIRSVSPNYDLTSFSKLALRVAYLQATVDAVASRVL